MRRDHGKACSAVTIGLALVIAGCSSTTGAKVPLTATPAAGSTSFSSTPVVSAAPPASPGRTNSPSPGGSIPPQRPSTPTLLYAVLEAPAPDSNGAHPIDTVAIAGLDGYARAKVQFTPRGSAYIPDAAVLRMPEAHVAAGGVYYIDGKGVVRELQASGANRQVATFPVAPTQQVISFAVSSDGSKIIAAVLTLPAVGPLPSPGGAPWPPLIGPWKLDIDLATSGGSTQTLHQWTSTAEPNQPGGFSNIVIVSWDAQGPMAVVGSNVATQNAAFNGQQLFGGHFARIDLGTGLPGAQIGNCQGNFTGPWSASSDGTTICAVANDGGGSTVTVQKPGQAIWEIPIPESRQVVGDFVLAPDGTRLAMDGEVVGREGVPLPATFEPEGWLDDQTLIGYEVLPAGQYTSPRMYYVWLQDSTLANDLGFSGRFVGVVS